MNGNSNLVTIYRHEVELKVLVTVPFPNVRGPLSKHTPWLIQGLQSLGCSVATERWERHHDNESFWQKVVGRSLDIVRITRRLRKDRFDALLLKTAHDWNTLVRDILLLCFARCRRPATIVQFHGSRPDQLVGSGHFCFKLATRVLLKLSDAILVLSQEECDQWHAFSRKAKVYRVSNAFVPREDVSHKARRLSLDPFSGERSLLFVSRLIVEKGILDLLDAFAILKERIACHLLVVGDGPAKKTVEERIRQLGIERHVTLKGYLTGTELDQVYRRSHLFVLPTFWAEGFPTVITEAMDAGLPIVTTKTRGIRDHLVEGRNALFVPARAPAELAAMLIRLLADVDLMARMSNFNKNDIEKFRPDTVATEYMSAIRDTVLRG